MGAPTIFRPKLEIEPESLIPVTTKADVAGESAAVALSHAQKRAALPEIVELSAFVQKAFEDAKDNRDRAGIDKRIEACRRVTNSEYPPDIMAKIKKQGGSETFFNITDTKVTAADAWINEVLQPVQGKPWSIRPTPIPSLPPDIMANAVEETFAAFESEIQAAEQGGEPLDVQAFQKFAMDSFDSLLDKVVEAAKRRTRNMEKLIEDQFAEGRFDDVLDGFIQALTEEVFACIKGPVLRNETRLRWDDNTGKMEVKDVVVPWFYNVESSNLYPSPNARTLQDGYLCEVGYMDPMSLGAMKGVDGWDAEAIEAVLKEFADASGDTAFDHTRAAMQELQDHDPHKDDFHASAIRYIEFWGPVQRKFVLDAGFPASTFAEDDGKTENDYDEMQIVMIGRRIVKAARNPDPKGRRPYHGTSYQKKSGTVWGKSISEKMADVQHSVSAALRHLQNNMALASGPMMSIDIDALDSADTNRGVYPGRVWQYRGLKTRSGGKPIEFFQPDAMVHQVLEYAEYMQQQADDRTLIPRFAHGNENVGGAGETASGLNMLMNAAAKGIRKVIKNVDKDVIRPIVRMMYDWNLVYTDDPSIKADSEVVPLGIVAELVREQQHGRISEFLQSTLNDTDMEIIGLEGRRELLERAGERFGIDLDKVIPDEDELRKRVEANLAAQRQQIAEEREAEQQAESAKQRAGASR